MDNLSLSFSFDGEHLISANDNDELELFQVADGAIHRTLHSKKYGVANVNYTHHHTQVIYSRKVFYQHGRTKLLWFFKISVYRKFLKHKVRSCNSISFTSSKRLYSSFSWTYRPSYISRNVSY